MKHNIPPASSFSGLGTERLVSGRRAVLKGFGLGVPALWLTGCGFALRQAPKFSFNTLRVTGYENTNVSRALQLALSSSGIQVYNTSGMAQLQQEQPKGAAPVLPQVRLHVAYDRRERVASGQTDSGQVRELTLRVRFRFRLEDAKGVVLIGDSEILMERDISYSETAALAKSSEESLIFRDMESDVVQQMLRRLAAVQLT